jgi:hypothetical protein
METHTFKVILSIVLIVASLLVVTLALILYSRGNTTGLWLVFSGAIGMFLLGSVTLVSTFRSRKNH